MKNVSLPNEIGRILPPPEVVRAALERLCASAPLKSSQQLTAFLRYVVEAVLEGHADKIKAYTIAVDALGRPDHFDPVGDAIVRVEAGRLRRALTHYYANDGRCDPISIGMAPGSYVPTFGRGPGADALLPARPRGATSLDTAEPDAHLTYCRTVLADGHSTLVRHQYLFARCHRDMAALSRRVSLLKIAVADSQRLVARSHGLLGRSRRGDRETAA